MATTGGREASEATVGRDPWLRGAVLAALVLRVTPLVAFGFGRCVRDECSYRLLATGIVAGEGLAAHDGWLWAPGYPYLLAVFLRLFGGVMAVKVLQVLLAALSVVLIYEIAARVLDRRAARIAAFLLALHPTLAFFSVTIWSEGVYSAILLGAVLAALWARDGDWRRALLPGALVGLCVLFRGVATYMAPIFALAMLWPATAAERRGGAGRAAALLLGVALVVLPWSVHASRTHGGRIVSDATLGQMMWLGNNDFPPVTFDYGVGSNRARMLDRWAAKGRPHCDPALPAGRWNDCEVANGKAWILANPGEFAARVPVRVAQLVNPHSFLTRHLRWDKWHGIPRGIEEALVLAVVLTSFVVLVGGTVGAFARASGAYGLLSVGIVAYHVAAIAALAGLTRYRAPLEPLWLVWAAALLADPRGTLAALRSSPARLWGCALTLAALLPLMIWYLPTGFPGAW